VKPLRIAIDGPVAAGKSTIARLLARALGYTYIDSGAMYRALAWATLREMAAGRGSESPPCRAGAVVALLDGLEISLVPDPDGANRVLVSGTDVTDEIRSQEVGRLASQLSELSEVRKRMVALQQALAHGASGVVMEGRDIQTVVMPEAEVKIFLTASSEERARRRCDELKTRGASADYDAVLAELKQRDERDSTRACGPLRAAPDAVWVNTDGMTIEQVVARILEIARGKLTS
jgi:cytidylate kinase